jgi:hypothetical protein
LPDQAGHKPEGSGQGLFNYEIKQADQDKELNEQEGYFKTEGSVPLRVFIHLVLLIHVILFSQDNFLRRQACANCIHLLTEKYQQRDQK